MRGSRLAYIVAIAIAVLIAGGAFVVLNWNGKEKTHFDPVMP